MDHTQQSVYVFFSVGFYSFVNPHESISGNYFLIIVMSFKGVEAIMRGLCDDIFHLILRIFRSQALANSPQSAWQTENSGTEWNP